MPENTTYDRIAVIEIIERDVRSITILENRTTKHAVGVAKTLLRKYVAEIGYPEDEDFDGAVDDGDVFLPTEDNLNGWSNLKNTNYDVHVIPCTDERFDEPEIREMEVE